MLSRFASHRQRLACGVAAVDRRAFWRSSTPPLVPSVMYEDNHLLVLAKPACMPSVPDESGDHSLLEWGKAYIRKAYNKPGEAWLAPVHRIDRPVSGVVCFARTSKAADRLSEQFRARTVDKSYLGVVERVPQILHYGIAVRRPGDGNPGEADSGRNDQWLRKTDYKGRKVINRVAPCREGDEGARLAVTEWTVLERRRIGNSFTDDGEGVQQMLMELKPITGRPHQLRVACQSLGFPLCGDVKYGAESPLGNRSVALHAWRLRIQHPTRREETMDFTAPIPLGGPWASWAVARRVVPPSPAAIDISEC